MTAATQPPRASSPPPPPPGAGAAAGRHRPAPDDGRRRHHRAAIPPATRAAWRLAQSAGIRVVLLAGRGRLDAARCPAARLGGRRARRSCAATRPASTSGAIGGNAGWGYADVLPSFKRLERYEAGANEHRGGDGPLLGDALLGSASPAPGVPDGRRLGRLPPGLAARLQRPAVAERGRLLPEGDQGRPAGTPSKRRSSTSRPAREAVVRVAGAQVTRVVFDGRRAVGVEFRQGGTRRTIRAGRRGDRRRRGRCGPRNC